MAKNEKILVMAVDYVEDYENYVTFQAVADVGHTVHVVCPGKNSRRVVRTRSRDFEGDSDLQRKTPDTFCTETLFRSGEGRRFDALRFPGDARRNIYA